MQEAGISAKELNQLSDLFEKALRGDPKATRNFAAKMDQPSGKWKRQSNYSIGDTVKSVLDSVNQGLAGLPPLPKY